MPCGVRYIKRMQDLKVCLIAIAKNEAAYLAGWIFHHLFFGFDEIHIWVNDTNDTSHEILKIINLEFSNVKIIDGDDLLKKCQDANENFQLHAYNASIGVARASACSHVMCLDIDELWTPSNFTTSIKEIASAMDCDVVAFPWAVDEASHGTKPFSPPFKQSMSLERGFHVKSLARITDRLIGAYIHSFLVNDGIYCLPSGQPFPIKGNNSYEILKNNYYDNKDFFSEEFFILHLVHKSPIEYIASLSRGRKHANDHSLFKINRVGFKNTAPLVEVRFEFQKLKIYYDEMKIFIGRCGLTELLQAEHQRVLSRGFSNLSVFRQLREYRFKYRRVLRGLNLSDLNKADEERAEVEMHIDSSEFNEGKFLIRGWVYNAGELVRRPAVYVRGVYVDCHYHEYERADVTAVKQYEGKAYGFEIRGEVAANPLISVQDVELLF
ncbi:hypothetical protein GOZ81_21225 [Agrobacterium vitis]|nr:hypothetical protein [Agrobacterium vitis]